MSILGVYVSDLAGSVFEFVGSGVCWCGCCLFHLCNGYLWCMCWCENLSVGFCSDYMLLDLVYVWYVWCAYAICIFCVGGIFCVLVVHWLSFAGSGVCVFGLFVIL